MKIAYISHSTEINSGYFIFSSELLTELSENNEVDSFYLGEKQLGFTSRHTARELEEYNFDDLCDGDLNDYDKIIVNLPILIAPPQDLKEHASKITFILHDVLMFCSSFGLNLKGDKCQAYKTIKGSCQDCEGYRGLMFNEYMNIINGMWINLMNRSNKVISPSQFIKDTFVSKGVNQKKVKVVSHFSSLKPAIVNKEDFVLIPTTNYKADTNALINIIASNPTQRFVAIVPAEPQRNSLPKYNNLDFITSVHHDDMPKLIGSATAVLHLSMADESFGLVVQESLMCKTPVITYPNGALAENSEEDGVIFLTDFKSDLEKAKSMTSFKTKLLPIKEYVAQI